ncbi:MAG: LLM class flavin-dependent oxidoreductase [Thermoleophilia bacterium]|nr:LLM class flavin-dependent oxidoreductase [Thermoleophilia bacterium]
MKFGLTFGFIVPPDKGISEQQPYLDMLDCLPRAEELGYTSAHQTEHHFQFDGHCPSPLVGMMAAAAVTEEMRVCTNVLLAPLYAPVRLAEDVAVLDNLSDGRLTLGVSPGYASEEFAGHMVPYEERFRRFEETMDLLQLAFTQETFEFKGEFFDVPPTRLSPKPVQKPHPPIWYGVSGPKLLRRAAKRHCILVASPRHTVPELKEHYRIYEEHCAEFGFKPDWRPAMKGVFVAETMEKAEEIAGPAVTHLFVNLYGKKSAQGERQLRNDAGDLITDMDQVDFETFKSRYLIGDPETVAEKLRVMNDELALDELTCWMHLPGISQRDATNSMELFAREIMPEFGAGA